MSSQKDQIVVVLGSGRSGTSLTMNIAHELGVSVSTSLTPENETNVKGAWEDQEILKISRKLMQHFHRNGVYLSYLSMPEGWLEDTFTLTQKEVLKTVLTKNITAAKGIWGFKEPVTAKLLPLWQIIFSELSIEPIYLLSLRNPRNVIRSFEIAYQVPAEVTEIVWLSRYIDAVIYTNANFIVLDYDRWFTNSEDQAKKILASIGKRNTPAEEVENTLVTIIDKKLYKASSNLPQLFNKKTHILYEMLLNYSGSSDQKKALIKEAKSVYSSVHSNITAYSIDFLFDNYDVKLSVAKKQDAIRQKQERIAINNGSYRVVAGVASYNKREEIFKITVASILPQVDHLYVYLNNYEHVPDYLEDSRITIFRSQDYGNLSANGKIFILDKLKSCYFFSIDDDILYPADYVTKMISCLNKYDNKVGVCVHGSIFPKEVQWYFERYATYPFQQELQTDKFVSLIGSGTFAFHTDTLKTDFSDFSADVMVDLNFSLLARQQKVPLVCIARKNKWLKALAQGRGLYEIFMNKNTIHTEVSKQNNPWGFDDYVKLIRPLIEDLFSDWSPAELKKQNMDIDFIQALETLSAPASWQETDVYYQKKAEREAMLYPVQTFQRNAKNEKLYIKQIERRDRRIALKNKAVEKKDKIIERRNKRIDSFLNSTSYQVGQVLVNAVAKPGKNTVLFPYYLIRAVLSSRAS